MENQEQEEPVRKDSNKIYFLIAVILALLGTNTYLFFKDKKANERIVTISDEKTRMQTEIDKIEAELDNASSLNIQLSEELQQEQEKARKKIDELRNALRQGQLTQSQLAKAQEEIKQLKFFVSKYSSEISDLKKQNASLTNERDELQSTVDSVNTKATALEKKNEELSSKVQTAAAIKAGNVSITAVNIRNRGKESGSNRSGTTDKLRVSFSVINNPLAEKGMHSVYMRVIDPNGNLIISNDGGMFNADDEELQYSYMTSIEFANDGKVYSIDWSGNKSFLKGTYTVLLYADGYSMGKGSVNLK
jgi:myosin heavy subunit